MAQSVKTRGGKLTAAKVRTIKDSGLYSDGDGLYLRVAAGGSRQWVARVWVDGKRRDMGLGGWPKVSLAEARKAAAGIRADAEAGLARPGRSREIPTFREAAEACHAAYLPTWRNGKHTAQWIKTLELYAFPLIGRRNVDAIERGDVLAVLLPIWTAKPETARRVRQRVRTVLRWAEAHGYVDRNVAGEAIEGALPRHRAIKGHFRALPFEAVADALERVERSKAWPCSKLALRFAVLTAARSGEVRLATWDEIDLDAATWRIPAARMKAGRDHRVPLSRSALEVLARAAIFRDATGLVFPSARGRAVSDATLSKLLRELGVEGTPHGFRSSFRDWCAETGKPRELAEAALAHVVGGVEGAYFRSDVFERRRALMAEWDAFLSGAPAKVIRPAFG